MKGVESSNDVSVNNSYYSQKKELIPIKYSTFINCDGIRLFECLSCGKRLTRLDNIRKHHETQH